MVLYSFKTLNFGKINNSKTGRVGKVSKIGKVSQEHIYNKYCNLIGY